MPCLSRVAICFYTFVISMGLLSTDQELHRLRTGMDALLAANDEKVSDKRLEKHPVSLSPTQL